MALRSKCILADEQRAVHVRTTQPQAGVNLGVGGHDESDPQVVSDFASEQGVVGPTRSSPLERLVDVIIGKHIRLGVGMDAICYLHDPIITMGRAGISAYLCAFRVRLYAQFGLSHHLRNGEPLAQSLHPDPCGPLARGNPPLGVPRIQRGFSCNLTAAWHHADANILPIHYRLDVVPLQGLDGSTDFGCRQEHTAAHLSTRTGCGGVQDVGARLKDLTVDNIQGEAHLF